MPKIVAQCRKRVTPYLYTLRRTIAYAYTLPNAIAYLNTCIPYLITCVTYLKTLTRFSALGSISQYIADSSRQHPRLSAANQNRVTAVVSQSDSNTEKTHQLRQPIRIEYYVTRVVSQSESSITSPESSLRHPRALGSGGGPFSALGSSRLAIAFLNTWGPPHPTWSAHTLTTCVGVSY